MIMTHRFHGFHAANVVCAAVVSLLVQLPAGAEVVMQGEFKDPVPGRIVYVRQQIPTVPIPPYRGKTYEDTVPDTYDVAERSRLSLLGRLSRAVSGF